MLVEASMTSVAEPGSILDPTCAILFPSMRTSQLFCMPIDGSIDTTVAFRKIVEPAMVDCDDAEGNECSRVKFCCLSRTSFNSSGWADLCTSRTKAERGDSAWGRKSWAGDWIVCRS